MFGGYKINNLPEYAQNYNYVVVRFVDDEFWFYGAYNDPIEARLACDECYGTAILR